MGTPATTARSAPSGLKLEDGYQSLIAFERDPDVSFWEIGVQPPGMDGGDPIDTTTQHNTTYRQMAARALITLTPLTIRAAYDPNVIANIVSNLINQNGSITIHFPDGSTLDFFGFIQTFEPDEMTEGSMPEASVTIVPTNTDPSDGSESAPVVTSVSGT